jgi:hypothetical protein
MRFVTEHTDDEGNRQPWSQLTELWNEEHQGEGRFTSRFGLRKAYLRAEKSSLDLGARCLLETARCRWRQLRRGYVPYSGHPPGAGSDRLPPSLAAHSRGRDH